MIGRLLLVVAVLVLSACGEDPGAVRAREVIDDLVAQEFGRASSRYRQFEAEILAPGAAPVWRRALDHQDATVREWAVDSLRHIGMPEDVDAIVARLDDTSRGVRQQAMVAVASLDPARARDEFMNLVESDRPEQVVLGAQGLASLEAREAAPAVIARFADSDLPAATRSALAQPLAALGDPAAARPLADAAADANENLQLRRLAVEALVALDGPEVAAQIARLVDADDDYVRTVAREAIRQGGRSPE